MSYRVLTCFLFIFLMSHSAGVYAAKVEHECIAESYVKCPSFSVSRMIGEHTPIIDNHVAGFTRSKGRWTIKIGYGPTEKCAKVSLLVNIGPIDSLRQYERVFINGGGSINDSGSFMHKIDDMESALRIVSSNCRVPASISKEAAEKIERQAIAEEMERQAMADAEKAERIALEEEQRRIEEEQKLAKEKERERLLAEQRRLAEEQRERERQRLAEEKRERERERLAKERKERWLKAERERIDREWEDIKRGLERRRLAEQRRRLERERKQRESDADTAAGMAILGGILKGLAGGSGNTGYRTPSYRGGGGGGGSCEQAQRRAAQAISSQRMASGSMCSIYRATLRMYQTARRYLANGGCPRHAIREYDRAIAQARRGVRAAC